MSFVLKTTVQPDAELSPQQKKLNRLIEKIEQQKIDLNTWEKAKEQIQQHARQTLVPAYQDLHKILFKQLEQLWTHLQHEGFSKSEILQLDEKIQELAFYLKNSNALANQDIHLVEEVCIFYQQHTENHQAKRIKKIPKIDANPIFESQSESLEDELKESDDFEEWDSEKHHQAREEAKRQRQQEKQDQAQKMADQSLKTVYLKIAALIHPDREQDEAKKVVKTEMLQHANEAYEKQDLIYLLKLQIEIEQNRGATQKGLTADQVKFYKLALDGLSQQLKHQIDEIINSLNWTKKAKVLAKNKSSKSVQVSDIYKQIDEDTSLIKQQVKAESERLKYMMRVRGLEMLLGSQML